MKLLYIFNIINTCVPMNERDYKRRAVRNELNNKYRRAFVAKRKKEKKNRLQIRRKVSRR